MSFLTFALLATLALSPRGVSTANDNYRGVINEVSNQKVLPSMPADPTVTIESWEKYSGEFSYLFDNDESTVLWMREPGDLSYLDIEFTSPVEIYDIQIIFNGDDFLRHSTWKWSNDGTHFMIVDSFDITENRTVDVQAYGVEATHLRLQTEGANSGKWVQIKEIKINQNTFANEMIQKISFGNFSYNYLPTDVIGFETSLKYMVDNDPLTYARFSGNNGNRSYIQFDFNDEIDLMSVSYQNPEAAKEKTQDHVYGAILQYLNPSTQVYEDINVPFNQTRDTYDKQLIYFRDLGIKTESIRFAINVVSGWIVAGDFVFNDNINDDDPIISVQNDNAETIHEGLLTDILDNDPSTYCWFAGKIHNITLDFGKTIEINDVKFVTGNGDGGDTFYAFVEYSTDNINYDDLIVSYVAKTSDTIVLDFPVNARYLRLNKADDIGWNGVKDFVVNVSGNATITAVGEGLTLPSVADSDINNAIDGDLETVVWYDYHFSSGTYFLLDLKEQTAINNIAFLQGGHTHEGATPRENNDILTDGQLSYSRNGYDWTVVDADCTIANVIYEFNSAVTARFVKMTYTGSGLSSFGLVIREFAVNYVKQAALIEWSDNLTPSYTGSAIKGYDLYSYAAGISVNYHNVREDTDSSDAPTAPGQYEVTISTTGNDIYNAKSETRNLHIMDTVSHFLSDWDEIIDNFCSNPDELTELIKRYDNDLSSEDKATVGASEYTGADSKIYTISYAIEYARGRQSLPNNGTYSMISGISDSNNIGLIITIVSIISLIAVSLTVIQYKKRKND